LNLFLEAFLFHIAGHDSSSATIAYILIELTRNEALMKRAKDDIKSTLKKHDGSLTYESVKDMKFIDLLVKESLRKYPILPMLNRECTKDYQIPGTDKTIEKGTAIVISLLGLHRDDNYFPNPEKFDPDRFADDVHDYDEDAYMPFGVGPRNCLGEFFENFNSSNFTTELSSTAYRMGLMFVKVGLVSLLMNFDFKGDGSGEIKFNKSSIAFIPKKGEGKMKITKAIM
jgi:cytochrome P450 family 6